MKKIFLLALFLISFLSAFSQDANRNWQFNKRVTIRGQLMIVDTLAYFIRGSDTCVAGITVGGYFTIDCTSGVDSIHFNPAVSGGGGSGVNIYNSDGVQTDPTRFYDGSGGVLDIDILSDFNLGNTYGNIQNIRTVGQSSTLLQSGGSNNIAAGTYLKLSTVDSLNITGLVSQSRSKDSMMVIEPSSGHIGYRSIPSGSGSGTVTSFSAGTLSPLFTTSVATATTTPALTFALSNAAAFTVFGRASGTGAPSFLAWDTTFNANNYLKVRGLLSATSPVSYNNVTGVISVSSIPNSSLQTVPLDTLNGLTANRQYFATGTSGLGFNISSASATHTFNLPKADATHSGFLDSTMWAAFNAKVSSQWITSSNRIYYPKGVGVGHDITSTNYIFQVANPNTGYHYMHIDTIAGNSIELQDADGGTMLMGNTKHLINTGTTSLYIGALQDGSAAAQVTSNVDATVPEGLVRLQQLTALAAIALDTFGLGVDITTTTLLTPASDGFYDISANLYTVATALGAGAVSLNIYYTDANSNAQTYLATYTDLTTTTTTTAFVNCIYAKSGTPIQYDATVFGIYNGATYDLHIRAVRK